MHIESKDYTRLGLKDWEIRPGLLELFKQVTIVLML